MSQNSTLPNSSNGEGPAAVLEGDPSRIWDISAVYDSPPRDKSLSDQTATPSEECEHQGRPLRRQCRPSRRYNESKGLTVEALNADGHGELSYEFLLKTRPTVQRKTSSPDDSDPPVSLAGKRRVRRALQEDGTNKKKLPPSSQVNLLHTNRSTQVQSSDSNISGVHPLRNSTSSATSPAKLENPYQRMYHLSRPTRTAKQLQPNISSKSIVPTSDQHDGESIAEDVIHDHDSTSDSSSSGLNNMTTKSTSKTKRRKLGLSDSLPNPQPPKKPSLDIVPSKKPQKPLDAGARRLQEFHTAFRGAFAPVHLNPDVLQYVTKKKKKLTLNHIMGREPYGPLYNIQDAIDKYKAERENQAKELGKKAIDEGLDSDDQAVNSGICEASGDEDDITSLKPGSMRGKSGDWGQDGIGFGSEKTTEEQMPKTGIEEDSLSDGSGSENDDSIVVYCKGRLVKGS